MNQPKLPDFRKMTSSTMILAPQLNVPDRSFTEGFPGVPGGLIEWFGIRFDAKIQIADAGSYRFLLTSDDGSKLYIDGDSVIDNDTLHPMTQRTGTKTLAAGTHTIRVDYFQGPRYDIGLILQWVRPGTAVVEAIPSDRFLLPDPVTIVQ
ncbi:MAG TPA: PA14 domain-containing protein [Gemmatimonadaceae bacterium]|nr:PA14 domain-containing protein [Gemmatimonadaceae bacterium]